MSFRFGIDLRLRRLLGAVLLVALALALALALVANAIPSPNANTNANANANANTNTNANANTNANTWHRAKQVHGPRSERVKIVENLVLNQLARGGDTDSNSDSNSNSETGRGNRTTQSKSKSKSQMNPSITTVGVIDLPQPGTNQRLRSSIVLVVDNDYDDDNDDDDPNGAVRIEDWLNDCLPPPVDDDSNDTTIDSGSSSNNNSNDDDDDDDESIVAVVESLALLCDELVLRVNQRGYDENNNNNNNNEEWRAAIRRGTDRRRSAGMSRGNLWRMHNDHESGPSRVVEIPMESTAGDGGGDDDRSSTAATTTEANSAAATTTRSILFPGTTGLPELKELVASTARKVIVSRSRDAHATAPERRSVPSVSVHYRGRSLSQEPGAGVAAEAVVASNNNNNDNDNDTRNPPATTKPPIASSRGDDTEVIADVLATARRKLEDLEAKMEELVLAQSSSSSSLSSSPMPLLEFGSLVQDVLETAETRLREETGLPEAFRRGLTKNIVAEVQRLYRDQLQALRNYYGQRYEAILDREPEKDGGDENNKDNDKDDDDEATERRWAVGAEHMTQGFRAAARNAVPVCFRIDANSNAHANIDANIDAWFRKEVTDALQGLIRDMMESTERRKEDRAVATLVEADDDENDTDGASPASRKLKFRFPEVPKWLERLAARAVVFGVNYIQGWLAWQGIKRAALERDRNQPKFPLF